jgi:hypothetical protein
LKSLQLCDEITLNKEKTTWTLTIQDVIKEDAGLYEICAVNSIGNDILKTRVYVKTVNRAPVENDVTCDRSVVFPCTPVSSTNKTDCHEITEILFESGVKHHKPNQLYCIEYTLHEWG